jgi:uncharacterized protein with PQ loop repeat
MLEIIGWIGSALLALCGIPQALKAYKEKHANGVDWTFLAMWGIGEILTLVYVFPKWHLPLIFNYVFNIIAIGIIVYYKIGGSKNERIKGKLAL